MVGSPDSTTISYHCDGNLNVLAGIGVVCILECGGVGLHVRTGELLVFVAAVAVVRLLRVL